MAGVPSTANVSMVDAMWICNAMVKRNILPPLAEWSDADQELKDALERSQTVFGHSPLGELTGHKG